MRDKRRARDPPPLLVRRGGMRRGPEALRSYRKEWDEERGVWCDRPRHDAASHGADAFRQCTDNVEAVPVDPIKELLKPKTLDQVLEEFDQEQEQEEH